MVPEHPTVKPVVALWPGGSGLPSVKNASSVTLNKAKGHSMCASGGAPRRPFALCRLCVPECSCVSCLEPFPPGLAPSLPVHCKLGSGTPDDRSHRRGARFQHGRPLARGGWRGAARSGYPENLVWQRTHEEQVPLLLGPPCSHLENGANSCLRSFAAEIGHSNPRKAWMGRIVGRILPP